MNYFKDSGHLFRFAGLFVVAFLVFWAIRGYVIPRTFGQYGHYRAAAITEIAQLPVHYAGHQTCETCHTDVAALKNAGKHAHVNCEACHGPLEKHAEDPADVTPPKLDTATLCVRCHSASAARPKDFPQVNAADHSNGIPCETCHQPHSPAIDAATTAKGGAK
jgi:transcription elongation factor Elf1